MRILTKTAIGYPRANTLRTATIKAITTAKITAIGIIIRAARTKSRRVRPSVRGTSFRAYFTNKGFSVSSRTRRALILKRNHIPEYKRERFITSCMTNPPRDLPNERIEHSVRKKAGLPDRPEEIAHCRIKSSETIIIMQIFGQIGQSSPDVINPRVAGGHKEQGKIAKLSIQGIRARKSSACEISVI